jgi:hypothetical protein
MKVTIEREATKEEIEAINKASDILAQVNLELIGTRPTGR